MNYCHTLGYYFDMRAHDVPAFCAIAQTKTFARQQPEFCQAKRDELSTTMFHAIRMMFGRPNRAPQCIQAYYTRKANAIGW